MRAGRLWAVKTTCASVPRARFLGDRVQRRMVLDPEPAVALDQLLDTLVGHGPAAANVLVVGRHVFEPFGRPVCHEDDGVAHAATRAVRSWTSSRRRRRSE